MKTCLYSLSYLDGNDLSGNSRLHRAIRFVNYYNDIKSDLGFDDMVFGDNGSSIKSYSALHSATHPIGIMRFEPHLPRGLGYNYPYGWRGIYAMQELIKVGFEKILLIDNDCFVLNPKTASYINSLKSGWTTFWCKKYGFPEAALQVICKDTFPLFYAYTSKTRWEDKKDILMEVDLPYTMVNKAFNCDRFGEDRVPQSDDMDIYAQANLTDKLVYG